MRSNISNLSHSALSVLKKNSPSILSGFAVVGVVASAVMTGMATPKAMKKLEQAKKEQDTKLSILDTIVVAGPSYLPAIAVGTSTILCILGANILNIRQQASITSAYALLNSSFKEYRGKLIELHGEEMDKEIREEIVRTNSNYHQIFVDTPDQKVFFYEPFSKTYIERYEREIMDAEYHLNRNFIMRGYSPLNEFLTFLGIPESAMGDSCGWSVCDGYCWIDFEHNIMGTHEGLPCYSLDAIFEPDPNYMDDWH